VLLAIGLALSLLAACGAGTDSGFGGDGDSEDSDSASDDEQGSNGSGQDDSSSDCGVCEGDLVIRAAADLEIASTCRHITGSLDIMQNSSLVPIDSLELLACLEVVDMDLLIGGGFRTELVYLNGLEGLTSVGGDLVIDNNDKLAGLNGLDGLTAIGGDLVLYDNDELGQIDALAQLRTVGGSLDIRDSDMLTDISGLESVESVAEDLDISWNATLCQSHASSIAIGIHVGGSTYVADNLGDCP